MSNSLVPDQVRRFVGPDLGPNCLPKLSADDTGRQRFNSIMFPKYHSIQSTNFSSSRVVQRNLVFVVGLSARLADTEVLKKHEYFGKYGKIHKVVINQSTSYAGAQVGRGFGKH